VFWVISVYFNIRNTLPKSGTFLLGHSVCVYIYIYVTSVNFVQYYREKRRMHLLICNITVTLATDHILK